MNASSKLARANTFVVTFEYRHPLRDPKYWQLRPTMWQWLAEHLFRDNEPGQPPIPNLLRLNVTPIECARNVGVKVARELPAEFEWVLFVDNDITPNFPGMHEFLAAEGDVVSCRCKQRNPDAWGHEDSFHTTFWRARADALRQIEPPWFHFQYSRDGTEIVGCECGYFRAKCLEAGLTVRHAGRCGHDLQGSWLR